MKKASSTRSPWPTSRPTLTNPGNTWTPKALDDLTTSIAQHGVLTPILFRLSEPAEGASPALFIVAGERRCEAAKKGGLSTVPDILVDGNHTEIALVENLLRQDLTPVEEAEALDRLVKEENYTQEQLGVIIGKARTTVSEILSLNRLPQEIRDECRSNTTVTRKALIAIARKKQTRGMVTAWNKTREKLAKEATAPGRKQRTAPTPATHCDWVTKALPNWQPSTPPPGLKKKRPPLPLPSTTSRRPFWRCSKSSVKLFNTRMIPL